MTRQELIEDIKRYAPHIAKIAGENFNWDRVAEMVENGGIMVRTYKTFQFDDDEVMDEDLYCTH